VAVIKSEVAPDWGEAALGRVFNLQWKYALVTMQTIWALWTEIERVLLIVEVAGI
jgi:hypothetical protein